MLHCFRLLFWACLLLSASTRPLWAFGTSYSKLPADLDQVEISLHTVDVGNLIYNNFGHTAIRVVDKLSGRDLVFNWGIFDFRDPLAFSLRFYRGSLLYKLGIYSFGDAYESYVFERRTVWEDTLDLTREQKEIFLKRLIWNAAKENRSYAYQHFFDNCSTRPRDYIDEALGGLLRKATVDILTPLSFRDMVYDGYKFNPGMDVFLDIAVNSRVDRPMTSWEKMFHPIALREGLLATTIDGRPLIKASRTIVNYQGPQDYKDLAYPTILIVLGLPLALIALIFFFRTAQPWVYRLLALVGLPLLSLGSLIGFLMPVTWVVSGHEDLHHNVNQFLFWPLDFLLIPLLLTMLWKGRPMKLGSRGYAWGRGYLLAHMVISLCLPLLFVLGLVHQEVGRVTVYILPVYLVLLLLIYRVGLRAEDVASHLGP
ncbi:MAG: DUF4105 domain-containing protein [Oligoflexus sp.]|jgi:hypothetical protein